MRKNDRGGSPLRPFVSCGWNSGVMVLLPPREEERRGDDQGERLGHGDGEPDAVDTEYFWQDQNCGDLNDKRAQK